MMPKITYEFNNVSTILLLLSLSLFGLYNVYSKNELTTEEKKYPFESDKEKSLIHVTSPRLCLCVFVLQPRAGN